MTDMHQCNFCYLLTISKFADKTGGELRLRPAPRNAEDLDGMEAILNGAVVCWFAKLPSGCVCAGRQSRVHVLHHGQPLCQFMRSVPQDWPLGHLWVPMERHQDANCTACSVVAMMAVEYGQNETFKCPDCGGDSFLEGPRGGLSINFCCSGCGARFNDCVGWVEKIPADGNERQTWVSAFRPRATKIRKE